VAVLELLVIGGVLGALALVAGIGLLVVAVLKVVFWIVLFPIRLAFKLLFLPFLLIKWLFVGVFGLLLAPLALVAVVVGVVGLLAALVVPLLPILFVAFAIWVIVKLVASPASAA
jgi:hypothetical protein